MPSGTTRPAIAHGKHDMVYGNRRLPVDLVDGPLLRAADRNQADVAGDPAAGGWRGAPVAVHLGRKLAGTTVLSALLWLLVWLMVESEWLSFRTGILAMPGQ